MPEIKIVHRKQINPRLDSFLHAYESKLVLIETIATGHKEIAIFHRGSQVFEDPKIHSFLQEGTKGWDFHTSLCHHIDIKEYKYFDITDSFSMDINI